MANQYLAKIQSHYDDYEQDRRDAAPLAQELQTALQEKKINRENPKEYL